MSKNISYIAMDVHKKNIVTAISTKKGKSELFGEYANNDSGVKKLLKKLAKIEGELNICYEAGPCGYALKRILDKKGYSCEIVAPSLIPKKAGDKIKTDKRDAKKLARLYRADELTFINVLNEQQEAVRDLVRCRDDLKGDTTRAKQRLNHFLIRHGYHFEGTNWTIAYRQWIQEIDFKDKYLQTVLNQYIFQLAQLELQLKDIDKEIEVIAETAEYKEKVQSLCAYKGIATLTAMIIIAEIVDFRRFGNPRELMAYLGMIPSEYSSGLSTTKGSITKCGNTRVRRALIESAWHNRHPVLTKKMKKDLEKIDQQLRVPPVKALKRLSKRYYYLVVSRGVIKQKAIVAIARELIGFIWDSMVMIEQKSDLKKVVKDEKLLAA